MISKIISKMEKNMEDYVPPFTITNHMLELVASISEKVGKVSSHRAFESKPHLRRNNRIKSIHSSLRIEANSLSLSEVRDVIDGHPVLGNRKEIQEVTNAYKAYDEIEKINPYNVSEIKRVHGIMTYRTVEESGDFRKGEEGVFSGEKCIFVAPPPKMVPKLMDGLFKWMRENQENIHPLIMSSVFHYEFVSIHPFSDGNGRIARLWHTAMLYNWRSIFEYIPLESRMESYQDEYYEAIEKCHSAGNSDRFIEFMLDMIDKMLSDVIVQIEKSNADTSEYVNKMLNVMEYDVPYPAVVIMDKLGLKSRETFRKNYMNPAIKMGAVRMTLPDKPNSKNQRYIKQ